MKAVEPPGTLLSAGLPWNLGSHPPRAGVQHPQIKLLEVARIWLIQSPPQKATFPRRPPFLQLLESPFAQERSTSQDKFSPNF